MFVQARQFRLESNLGFRAMEGAGARSRGDLEADSTAYNEAFVRSQSNNELVLS